MAGPQWLMVSLAGLSRMFHKTVTKVCTTTKVCLQAMHLLRNALESMCIIAKLLYNSIYLHLILSHVYYTCLHLHSNTTNNLILTLMHL